MVLCFKTLAVLLLGLLAAVTCAPTGQSQQDACAAARSSSLELNRLAKNASIEARRGDRSQSSFTTSLAWMEATDMCSPEALRQTTSTCTAKMLKVLRSYSFYVEQIYRFPSCSQFARILRPALHDFLRDMSQCLTSHHQEEEEEEEVSEDPQPMEDWQEPLLCHYTLDRLFSFSIISARVFAVVGGPVQASGGPAQRCW